MSLSQFRGKVVLLSFIDSRCQSICPLTAREMLGARQLLGAAGSRVQLLAVDANPRATAVPDVLAFSRAHGMVNRWDFLTGPEAQLRAVWKAYHIYVYFDHGQVEHTGATYVIDQQGRERKVYLTQTAFASVGQAAQIMAQELARLLPGHPPLARLRSLAYIPGQTPRQTVTMPGASPSGGHVTLSPGKPHLVMFFATWLSEVSNLRAELTGLNSYARAARHDHLPGLVAVDEAVTEPAPGAAHRYLRRLGQPLAYPVALDTAGRVADGYGVQEQPWFTLTSAAGRILWSHGGWLAPSALEHAVQRAISGRQG